MGKIIKFVDTSHLPRKKNNSIDWKKSIGYRCSFLYGDLSGEIEILGYIGSDSNPKLKVTYQNIISEISISSFKNGIIGNVVKQFTKDFKYKICEIINTNKQDLQILDRNYVKQDGRNRKYYKYKCLTCNQESTSSEGTLKKIKGCPVCEGKIVVEGINDIPTTAPWMIDYFQGGYDEAKLYTKNSTKKIYPKCPVCKTVSQKLFSISQIYNSHSCGCKCDTYMSFPEQVMYNLLANEKIIFIHEATKNDLLWANNYKYDFYLPNFNMIIEMHGSQHYGHGFFKVGGKSLEEEQENDKRKKHLALSNGIENYFEIDCRKSDIDWILNSINISGLLSVLNIKNKDIDINSLYISIFKKKIDECKNILVNNPNINSTELCKRLYVCKNSLNKILKILNINLKSYRTSTKNKNYKKTPITIFKDGEKLGTFESYNNLIKNAKELYNLDIKIHDFQKYVKKQIIYKEHYTFEYPMPESEVVKCY